MQLVIDVVDPEIEAAGSNLQGYDCEVIQLVLSFEDDALLLVYIPDLYNEERTDGYWPIWASNTRAIDGSPSED